MQESNKEGYSVDDVKFHEAMVFAKEPGQTFWKGVGHHTFRVLPRIGEHIAMDNDEGHGYLYRVVMIHHPIDLAQNIGDIYMVQDGPIIDVMERAFTENPIFEKAANKASREEVKVKFDRTINATTIEKRRPGS